MGKPSKNTARYSPALELVAGGIGDPVVRLRFLKYVAPDVAGNGERKPRTRHWLLAAILLGILAVLGTAFLVRAGAREEASPSAPARVASPPVQVETAPTVNIWQVEDTRDFETYSNGLRIDNRYVVSNHRRAYRVFPTGEPRRDDGVPANRPAGIVFHTTESRQAPLEERENGMLKRIEGSLIQYVQHKKAYHFLIDRFGRVYRIVAEGDAANHAGYSVWSDGSSVYINLNESFLGVSFEAETRPGQEQATVSAAQIHAARLLTEMLRKRYSIPSANCVTHAQVSVNPSNMGVGYHTDWASSFPFEQLGLPDNYSRAAASVWLFGFQYDPVFLRWAGTRLYAGIELAEGQLRDAARRSGTKPAAYRKMLQKHYRERLAAARRGVEGTEEGSE